MHRVMHPIVVRVFLAAAFVAAAAGLAGCAGVRDRDPVHVNVVGLDPLAGEGLEMRFDLKLRVQNPNDSPLEYDGIAVELELHDKPFATGVSDRKGSVPRFGETVLRIPISVSAFAVVRQALKAVDGQPNGSVPYVLRGKLAGGAFGTTRFLDRGRLTLPGERY